MNQFQDIFFGLDDINHPNEKSLKIIEVFKKNFPCEVAQLYRYSVFDESFSGVMQYHSSDIKSLQHIHEFMHINEYVNEMIKSNKVNFLEGNDLQISIGAQSIVPIVINNMFLIPISMHDVVIAFISGININFKMDDKMFALAEDFKIACSHGLKKIDNRAKSEFTERELMIIQYVSYGYSTKEIAEGMNFSEANIKYFIKNIMEKTNSKSRTEAVGKLFRMGVLK